MSYSMQWPGFSHISFVIIDPKTKKVFTKESPLPMTLEHLDKFQNKYVKLSDILSMFKSKLDESAISVLHDLIKHFSAKPMLDISIKYALDKTSYLPVSTLLIFALVWPLCKNFQKLRNSMINFVENFSEKICSCCGFEGKGCSCVSKQLSHESEDILGYSIQLINRGSQTSNLLDSSDKLLLKEASVTLKPNINENHHSDKSNETDFQNGFKKSSQKSLKDIQKNHIFESNSQTELLFRKMDSKEVAINKKQKSGDINSKNKSLNQLNESNKVSSDIKDKFAGSEVDVDNGNNKSSDNKYNKRTSKSENFENSKKLKIKNKEKINDKDMILKFLENEESWKRNKVWKLIENEDSTTRDCVYSLYLHLPTKEKILKCKICGQCFETKLVADLHDKVHKHLQTNPSQFSTMQQSTSSKTHHLQTPSTNSHHKVSPSSSAQHIILNCLECMDTFPSNSWFLMLKHLSMSHNTIISCHSHHCSMCGLHFDTEHLLSAHTKFHYSNRYKCMHCLQVFPFWKQVESHLKECLTANNKTIKDSVSSHEATSTHDTITDKPSFVCPYCPFIFHKHSLRNLHVQAHIDNAFKCTACAEVYNDWRTLRKHIQNNHAHLLTLDSSMGKERVPLEKCKGDVSIARNHQDDSTASTKPNYSSARQPLSTSKSTPLPLNQKPNVSLEEQPHIDTSALNILKVSPSHHSSTSLETHIDSPSTKSHTPSPKHQSEFSQVSKDDATSINKNSLTSHIPNKHIKTRNANVNLSENSKVPNATSQTNDFDWTEENPLILNETMGLSGVSQRGRRRKMSVKIVGDLDESWVSEKKKRKKEYDWIDMKKASVLVEDMKYMKKGAEEVDYEENEGPKIYDFKKVAKEGMKEEEDEVSLSNISIPNQNETEDNTIAKDDQTYSKQMEEFDKSNDEEKEMAEEERKDKRSKEIDGHKTVKRQRGIQCARTLRIDQHKALLARINRSAFQENMICPVLSSRHFNSHPYHDHPYFKYDLQDKNESSQEIGKNQKNVKPGNFSFRTTRSQIGHLEESIKPIKIPEYDFSIPDEPSIQQDADLNLATEMNASDLRMERELFKNFGGVNLVKEMARKLAEKDGSVFGDRSYLEGFESVDLDSIDLIPDDFIFFSDFFSDQQVDRHSTVSATDKVSVVDIPLPMSNKKSLARSFVHNLGAVINSKQAKLNSLLKKPDNDLIKGDENSSNSDKKEEINITKTAEINLDKRDKPIKRKNVFLSKLFRNSQWNDNDYSDDDTSCKDDSTYDNTIKLIYQTDTTLNIQNNDNISMQK